MFLHSLGQKGFEWQRRRDGSWFKRWRWQQRTMTTMARQTPDYRLHVIDSYPGTEDFCAAILPALPATASATQQASKENAANAPITCR